MCREVLYETVGDHTEKTISLCNSLFLSFYTALLIYTFNFFLDKNTIAPVIQCPADVNIIFCRLMPPCCQVTVASAKQMCSSHCDRWPILIMLMQNKRASPSRNDHTSLNVKLGVKIVIILFRSTQKLLLYQLSCFDKYISTPFIIDGVQCF